MTSVETPDSVAFDSGAFDSVAFTQAQRSDWQLAASGWRRWYDVIEAAAAGQVVSRKLVDLARLGAGIACSTWPPATASQHSQQPAPLCLAAM
jgi:hypothetical protein